MTKQNHELTRRQFIWLTSATSATLALAACTPAAAPSEGNEAAPAAADSGEAAAGGTIRVAFPSTANHFDPFLVTSFEEFTCTYALYDGLTLVDASLIAQPHLAESWEISDDSLTWTFTIRQGVKFHNGADMTTEDVAHSFTMILDPDVGSPLRTPLGIVDSVEAVDDTTVVFNLNSANSDLGLILGSAQAKIVPRDSDPEQLATEPVGTGPFMLSEHVPGDHTTLVANPDYWGEGPYLDEVRLVAMPEQTTQVAAISGGTIDLVWQLGAENIPSLEGTPDVQVLNVPSGAYQTIAMNAEEEPFTDTRVRQAVRMCINRPGVLQAVLQGVGETANDHPIPNFNPFVADIPLKDQNTERAKELLAEAGYEDGIELTLTTSTVRAGMQEFAVAAQEMCKEAGINITIDSVPPDNYWSEVWMKRPFFCSNWGFRPSIDEALSLVYHSDANWNEGEYRNPELDAAIEGGRSTTDPEERAKFYGDAQQILHDDGSVIISYFKPVIQVQRDNVQGFTPHPTSWIYLHTVSVS